MGQELEREAAEAASHLETLIAEQTAGTMERDHLRTIGATRPWVDRLHAAREILRTTVDAPELDETFEQRWREALENAAKSASIADTAEKTLLAANETRAALQFDPIWIESETAIDALAELRGLAVGAEADLPKRRREVDEKTAKSVRLRQDLGWEATMVPPPAPEIMDAQRRLRRFPRLELDAVAADREKADAARALSARQAELDALAGEADVARIADLAKLLRSGGDPAMRLDAGRRKLRLAEAALTKALAAIPDRKLSERALAETAAPSDPKLEAADKALSNTVAAHAEAVRTHADRLAEIENERTALTALEQTAALPPPDALAAARARRDSLWNQLFTPAMDMPGPGAAVSFDRAMRETDTIADALIAHGREVAEATALRNRLTRLESDLTKYRYDVTRTAGALTNARNDLAAMARAAGGEAEEMAGLRAFLRAREAAVLRRGERDAAAIEFADTEADLLRLGRRLAEAMEVAQPGTEELTALLAEADRRIVAATSLAASRTLLTKQIREQSALVAAKASAADGSARALNEWFEQWRPLARALARPEGEAPAATSDALSLIEELRLTEAEREALERRIGDMLAAIGLLAGKIRDLAGLSRELALLPPIEAAESFRRRLDHERLQAARCRDGDARIDQAMMNLARSRVEAETASRTMIGLRAALHATTNEEAESQLQRARAVAAARKDSAEAMRELAIQGGGLRLEVLASRALESTAEADTARIGAIDARHAELTAMIVAARDKSAAAAGALEQAGSGLEASEAARRREAAQAVLARTAEEALVLHAAHSLLRVALDRQAGAADQPLLARIGEVFRTITGGVQAGVKIEDARDGQTMVALEADGITRKLLDQLSEGTSDQLYLALRIAALEDYAAAASPLPFIADDVLQTFDDPRTTATMRALVGLSDTVQVIALTHHPHIAQLAAAFPACAVNVIRLGD